MAEQTASSHGEGEQREYTGGADQSGQQDEGTAPERLRRRKMIVISVAAAAAVLIAGGIGLGVAVTSGGGQSLPSTLLGLARDTSPGAQQAAGQFTSQMGVLQGIIVNPSAAIYGPGPNGIVILTGHWSQAAKTDGLVAATSAGAVAGLRSEGVTDASAFPAGPRGGGLACGRKELGGQMFFVCALEDNNFILMTVYLGTASSPSNAAAETVEVRSAVEH